MPHIYKCLTCNEYTMKEICSKCGAKTVRAQPPRFSPQDRYGKWRRIARTEGGGVDE